MTNNNENETKELSFGSSNEENQSKPQEKEGKPTPNEMSGGNSFYDRKEDSNKEGTVWYKDWRGKTLGLSLAALILIGAGIPAGMAAAGYFSVKDEEYPISDITTSELKMANEELDRLFDKAIIDHFEDVRNEGWISNNTYEDSKEEAEKQADETIDEEIKALKKTYGNTWEEEWDEDLKDKGFHTKANGGEDEYRDSLVSSYYESTIQAIYTNKNKITERENDYSGDARYQSSEEDRYKRTTYVLNTYENETYDGVDVEYTYTPQDLMDMYLYTYQPVVFNNALLPFTPVVGSSTEASIQGNNIIMTNDDVYNMWLLALQPEQMRDQKFSGVMSANAISFSGQSLGEEADIAVMLKIMDSSALSSSANNLTTIVENTFGVAAGSLNTITPSEIEYYDDDEIKNIQSNLEKELVTAELLNSVDAGVATGYRKAGSTSILEDHVSFVSTNGLNIIGKEVYGEEILIEQLDFMNKSTNDPRDFDIWNSYTTWFSNSFKKITIIDYLSNSTADGWFNDKKSHNLTWDADNVANISEEFEGKENVLAYALFQDVIDSQLDLMQSTYIEAESFFETNKKYYDYDTFIETTGYELMSYYTTTNIGEKVHTIVNPPAAKADTILTKGDDQ